ncbi:MAG: cysteine hydrolase [Candidatus Methanomethylophilaceae archaeon]|nr:cysteine hydrolase [Candidatus Methanomethylophilaceae archaeon]MBP5735559.1 cysteine hydrolase [Candidatus Methanomethylophilaceae archaeon]
MKALVVVDYQNDHVTGPMGGKFIPMIEKNICKRIEDTIKMRGDVYFVIDSFGDGMLPNVDSKSTKYCVWGTKGAEIYGKVGDYLSSGYLIRKSSPGSEELMKKLRLYDEIELCGVETDVDILANAIIARTANPSALVIIRQNCVASRNSELAEEALDIMTGLGLEIL